LKHQSPTLRSICQEMLLYSTNLTAEICGLAATQARLRRSLGIEASAAEMTRWLGETYGIECDFKDHSGLSDVNRISAGAMARVLLQEGPDSDLRPILRRIPMRDKASGEEVPAGSIAWNRRSKRLQQQLLQRWGLINRLDVPVTEAAAPSPGGVALDGLVVAPGEGG